MGSRGRWQPEQTRCDDLGAHETLEDHHADSDCIVRSISSVRSRSASVSVTMGNCSASDGVRRRRGGTLALNQLGLMFVGAVMPTPLNPLYRQTFGFSGIVMTLIFAV